MRIKFPLVSLALGLLVGGAGTAHALSDFTGYYDVSHWTTTDTSSGSVDTSGKPFSITLTSGNSNLSGDTDFTITVPQGSWISFNWTYNTSDVWPELDPFGYLINGVFTSLISIGDIPALTHQSGHETLLLAAGDVFGFRANTFDGYGGSAVTTITNFTVPEPATLALFGIGLAGFRLQRRRSA